MHPTTLASRAVNRAVAVLASGLTLLALAACSRIETQTETDSGADLSGLHTYAWVPRKTRGGSRFSEGFRFTDRRVREAVDRELADRGFRRVAADARPDFWVQYSLWADEGVTGGGPYDHPAWGRGRWGTLDRATGRDYGDYRMSARDVRQGTLIITILDGETRRELWRGTAQAMVKDQHDEAKVGRLIDEAVQRILRSLPSGRRTSP